MFMHERGAKERPYDWILQQHGASILGHSDGDSLGHLSVRRLSGRARSGASVAPMRGRCQSRRRRRAASPATGQRGSPDARAAPRAMTRSLAAMAAAAMAAAKAARDRSRYRCCSHHCPRRGRAGARSIRERALVKPLPPARASRTPRIGVMCPTRTAAGTASCTTSERTGTASRWKGKRAGTASRWKGRTTSRALQRPPGRLGGRRARAARAGSGRARPTMREDGSRGSAGKMRRGRADSA